MASIAPLLPWPRTAVIMRRLSSGRAAAWRRPAACLPPTFTRACSSQRSSPPPSSTPPSDSEVQPLTDSHVGLFGYPRESMLGTVPNVLSTLRIVATPLLCGAVLADRPLVAAAGFVAAGVLDAVDGYIARRYDQRTVYGSFLDPLADKVLVSSLSLTLWYTIPLQLLWYHGVWPTWLVGAVVGRDALIVACVFGIRWWTKAKDDRFFNLPGSNFDIQPSVASKVHTGLSLGLICGSLLHTGGVWATPLVTDGLSYAVVGTTVWSLLSYAGGGGVRFAKQQQQQQQQQQQAASSSDSTPSEGKPAQ